MRHSSIVAVGFLLLTGCSGPQSALQPSGAAAREIAALWWWMFGAAVVIFLVVLFLLLYASLRDPERRWAIAPRQLIIGGGIVFPVVVLSVLLVLGINVGSGMHQLLGNSALTIKVTAHQWWWEVEYSGHDGHPGFSTANELYLPVGQPVEVLLESADVVHSFWVPRLAGKLDMIPGTTNRLVLEAEESGVFRGQCAEFCGESHTQMALYTVALPEEEFQDWARSQRQPQTPRNPPHPGGQKFRENGCPLCHTVRGHQAWGKEAPDLTHIGSRKTIGAGLLENNPRNIARWLSHNEELKPGNLMPEYKDLDLGTRLAIGDYLESLE